MCEFLIMIFLRRCTALPVSDRTDINMNKAVTDIYYLSRGVQLNFLEFLEKLFHGFSLNSYTTLTSKVSSDSSWFSM